MLLDELGIREKLTAERHGTISSVINLIRRAGPAALSDLREPPTEARRVAVAEVEELAGTYPRGKTGSNCARFKEGFTCFFPGEARSG